MKNIVTNKHEYSMFFFILPTIILLAISTLNLFSSFSLMCFKNIFITICFLSVLYLVSFMGDFLERFYIFKSNISLISSLCLIVAFYFALDNEFLGKLLSNLYVSNSPSSYLLLYVSFLSHIINSIFTVLFCISLIIFIPQMFLGSIFTYFTSSKISFSLFREIAIIFVLTLSFKSICMMLIEKGL